MVAIVFGIVMLVFVLIGVAVGITAMVSRRGGREVGANPPAVEKTGRAPGAD